MNTIWRSRYCQFRLAAALAIVGAVNTVGSSAIAQVRPDNTLGAESSRVTSANPGANQIDGGATRGTNLFHSFAQFSVPTNGIAFFNNAPSIQNIISRVTGGSISNIDGLIRANGKANLFLINPNGIIFGRNASVSIGGSFVGSTASSLKFADGTQFNAKDTQTTPLLTISVPLGLQFGGNPGRILVQGSGNQLSQDPQTNANGDLIGTTLNRSLRPVGLQVQQSQTLALVAGDVVLEGGNLTATDGRIELGSVAGTGFVSLNSIDKGWALGYEGERNFGNIQLSQAASVDVSGTGGGDIQVRGRRITLTDGSVIAASTLGAKPGGTLTVAADDAMELTGTDSNHQISSSLYTETLSSGSAGDITIDTDKLIVRDGGQVVSTSINGGAAGKLNVSAPKSVELVGTGNVAINAIGSLEIASGLASTTTGTGRAGDVTIATNKLSAINGAQISSVTYGTGSGGNLVVNAKESVELSGGTADFPSGLETSVESGATGAGGNLTLETGRLSIRDGAQIAAGTSSTGDAGNLVVNAKESVELIGSTPNGQFPSGLLTSSSVLGATTGAGGNLTLETGRLSIRDGAQIAAVAVGTGAAGNLVVNAKESVELIGTKANGQLASGLFTSTQSRATGAGGNLTLETGHLSIRDGAVISSATFGKGNAGNLVVNAKESVELIGTSANGQSISGLFTSVQPGARGAGGNLTLETGRLSIRDGAVISSGTLGEGSAGILTVKAKELVELIGTLANGQRPSILTAQTNSSGNASNINIETEKLTVWDGARLSVSSQGSGKAGNLSVQARSIQLDNRGAITATTRSGNGGDITLQAQDLLLLRRGSQISATAGTAPAGGNGGNITINSPFIVALPSENSDITANAYTGKGGNIQIAAQGIFGIQRQAQNTPLSDITASSQLGINGTVQINTLVINPTQGLVTLPVVPVDVTGLIAQGCPANVGPRASKFVITGRGGLPPNPSETLSSDTVWTDLRPRDRHAGNRLGAEAATPPTNSTQGPLVEATGWVTNDKGEVVLVAQAPTVTPDIPWLRPTTCHTQ